MKEIVAIQVGLLAVCLLSGWYLYHDYAGTGYDDMWIYNLNNPGSEWVFVKNWYFNINGRIGALMMVEVLRLLFRLFNVLPDSISWWLILSIGLFFNLAAPVNLVLLCWRVIQWPALPGIALLVFLWGLWAASPAVYHSALQFPILYIQGYSLCIYLATLLLLALQLIRRDNQILRIIIPAFVLILCLCHEQVCFALPILCAAVVLCRNIGEAEHAIGWFRVLLQWSGVGVLAALIIFLTPGQLARISVAVSGTMNNSSGGAATAFISHTIEWYWGAENILFDTYFHVRWTYYAVFHSSLLILLTVMAAFCLWSFFANKRGLHGAGCLAARNYYGTALLSIGLLLASLFSMIPSCFIGFAQPERHYIQPGIWYLAGLFVGIYALIQFFSGLRRDEFKMIFNQD